MSELTIHLSGIVKESIVDGPGFRFVVFVQGCPHHCPGCHNPQTHAFEGGTITTPDEIINEVKKNKLISGITLSGGEPFCQAPALSALVRLAHENGLNVMTYTGYTIEYLLQHADEANGYRALLEQTDILIDGPFVLEQKSLLLKFRGSKNQRVIDCKASLAAGQAVERDF